jgi:hypothetical protein
MIVTTKARSGHARKRDDRIDVPEGSIEQPKPPKRRQ